MFPRLFPTAKSDPELAPFRPGLVLAFFNALSWQIGIGTPMVLFAEQLGASTFQVGLAYSFVFPWFFVTVVAAALVLLPLMARLPEDIKAPVEPILIGNAALRPFRAASYLVNLIDVRALRRAKPEEGPPGG